MSKPTTGSAGSLRRYLVVSTAGGVTVLLGFLCAVTVTSMGGVPERNADGALILNNHGAIAPAGSLGWAIARFLHVASLSSIGIVFALGGAMLVLQMRPQDWPAPTRRQRWVGGAVFLAGFGLVLGWGLILQFGGLGAWLRGLR